MNPLYTRPDEITEFNLGTAAYDKPSQMLNALRNVVLGPERFDAAFRLYIQNWAYKHPTPWDFFRTMENASGEDLNWFWRGMFLNNYKLDQGVKEVKYVINDPKNGALLTIENNGEMAMPVSIKYQTESGKTDSLKLPVEVWHGTSTWTVRLNSTEPIKSVTIDPDKAYPDINYNNNTWDSKL